MPASKRFMLPCHNAHLSVRCLSQVRSRSQQHIHIQGHSPVAGSVHPACGNRSSFEAQQALFLCVQCFCINQSFCGCFPKRLACCLRAAKIYHCPSRLFPSAYHNFQSLQPDGFWASMPLNLKCSSIRRSFKSSTMQKSDMALQDVQECCCIPSDGRNCLQTTQGSHAMGDACDSLELP